jgi:plasmid maintenance system antidote protein VapI
MIINNFIKGLVDAQQVRVVDLADMSGYSIQHLEDIINERVATTPQEAYKLLKSLGYDLDDVLEVY